MIASNENERYDRHKLIEWFSQEKLKNTYIAVVGAGAIGNEVLKNLVLLGIGKIDVFDFDKIEIHNLTRTVLFNEDDIGKYKSDVCKEKLFNINPEELSIEKVKKYDCIISCADNFEIRIKLNTLCYLTKTNFINLAIDSKFVTIDNLPFSLKSNSSCYECSLPETIYNQISKRYSCGWLKKVAFNEKKIPTTIITSSVAASIGVSNALNFENINNNNAFTKIFIDSTNGYASKSKITKKDSCPGCNYINDNIIFYKSNPAINNKLSSNIIEENIYIYLSDPLIFDGKCTNTQCSYKINEDIILKTANNFNSSLTFCTNCKDNTILFEIKDRISLKNLLENYKDYVLDCKYIYFIRNGKLTVIEMEKNNE